MFAVIKTGGKQYKVQEGDILSVEKLSMKKDKKVTFDKVLLVEDDGKTLIGTPFVENALVRAEVIEDFKDKKVIVFKKKRRKQYRRTRGHRQELTRIKIEEILHGAKAVSKKKPAEVVKKEKVKVAPEKKAPEKKAPKVAKKEETKAAPKKPVVVSEAKPKKPKSKAPSEKPTKAKAGAKTKKTVLKKEK
ncbi:MAG: 50S ribosomal protein L21 [Candidatus Aminicenantes bacterium]|nr:50S ribosomal protein L21 [Candidatus Aminicenantes bacterium]